MGVYLAPSMMAIDFLNTREQLEVIGRRGGICHLDVMDGHFAPNLGITPDLARAFRASLSNRTEAHLMTDNPALWIDVFAGIGAEQITLHAETIWNKAFRLFDRIEMFGCRPGIALCPATAIDSAAHLLHRVSLVTIMSVDIGYSGAKFIPEMISKVKRADELRRERGYTFEIQVDGGCGKDTYGALRAAGADRFVTGSALFSGGDANLDAAYDRVIREIEEATGEELIL
ncbi:MAG: allulose-6-phosphate 3-epimerase [Oscillospiraceae bacterium]|jgi:D-allulose-6-phosphate 3-epimerase|nr:allulose-6-phosphate 3-epimerase [Oscillospiraceae bacterium]